MLLNLLIFFFNPLDKLLKVQAQNISQSIWKNLRHQTTTKNIQTDDKFGAKRYGMKKKEDGVPHQGVIFHARALRFGISNMLAKTEVCANVIFIAQV